MSVSQLVAFLLIGVMSSSPGGSTQLCPVGPVHGSIEVHGHRGARGNWPENTLPAFQYALEVGVDFLELDVVVTKDNKLVVMHDLYVNPALCFGPNGKRLKHEIPIRSLDLSQLKTFDCGTLKNSLFPEQKSVPGERVPTLAEVFELVKHSKLPRAGCIRFNIETKIIPGYPTLTPDPVQFAKLLVQEIRKYGFGSRVIIQSFDFRTLREVRRLAPDIKLSLLVAENHPDLLALVRSVGVDYISPNYLWITGEDVAALHDLGVKVLVWTPNRPHEWSYVLRLGVDGIITDYPGKLIKFLQNNF